MESFKAEDFEKMNFRVDLLEESSQIFTMFPVLKVYPEFRIRPEGVSYLSVIKYIGAMYQINSPFLTIDNYTKRKVSAAIFAGFEKSSKKEFTPHYNKILKGENSDVNCMIVRFCRIQKSTTFSRLVVFEEAFHDDLLRMKNSDDKMGAQERGRLRDNIQNIGSDITQFTRELLFEDDNKYLISEVFEEIEIEQLNLKPEDIAMKLRNGEEPVNIYPYGEDYKVPKIRYAQVPVIDSVDE